MSVSENHLQHCMLYKLKKGSATKNTVKNVCKVYGEHVSNVRKCQKWFSKFPYDVFEFSNEHRSGRSVTFDVEALKAVIEVESP